MALAEETTTRIRRETDATLINAITNDPSVKATFGYNPEIMDFGPVFAEPEHNIVLSNGHSVVGLFIWSAPRVWQEHFAALPHARGAAALASSKAMCDYIFEHHGAKIIWAMIPLDRPEVITFAYLTGFEDEGESEDAMGRPVKIVYKERG